MSVLYFRAKGFKTQPIIHNFGSLCSRSLCFTYVVICSISFADIISWGLLISGNSNSEIKNVKHVKFVLNYWPVASQVLDKYTLSACQFE